MSQPPVGRRNLLGAAAGSATLPAALAGADPAQAAASPHFHQP